MAPRILHLFPDTNLFAQCRPLEELDWERWGNYDEVHLIVSRPVQTEIDHHKNRGSDRLARRAKLTSSLLREVILAPSNFKLIAYPTRTVKLFLKTALRPATNVADQLNYEFNDDQLVGIAYEFSKGQAKEDVRVLTHDTGPMASAKTVGLEIAAIPDEWLLPPEASEKDKAMKALEAKVRRLEGAEPRVQIGFMAQDGQATKEWRGEITLFEALTGAEVSAVLKHLKSRFPMQTDFTAPPSPAITYSTKLLNIEPVYEPPAERLVTKYQADRYPAWLKACETYFRKLHKTAQAETASDKFIFHALNSGSRPAKDVLVNITAKGNFELVNRKSDDKDTKTKLAAPPDPPKGVWGARSEVAFARLAQMATLTDPLRGMFSSVDSTSAIRDQISRIHTINARDPNDFYWKPRPHDEMPVGTFTFECKQWRHNANAEPFTGHLYFEPDIGQLAGVLECEIHAENLTAKETLLVPVRLTVTRERVLQRAYDEIDALTRSHLF